MRVGLAAVLDDLDREGVRVDVPARAAVEGFTWDARDRATRRWWPQGLTTSAHGRWSGRPVMIASWYAKGVLGLLGLGSRITVVDPAGERPRYRHVRLVHRPGPRWLGPLRPVLTVRVHAGGLAWEGTRLYVAAGPFGFRVFDLDDVERVSRWRGRGYRYVLPMRSAHRTRPRRDRSHMTWSFLTFDRAGDVPRIVAGEYGTKSARRHRIVRHALDDLGLPASADPEWFDDQPHRMQGTCQAGDRWFVTASAGEGNPGALWVGAPGRWRKHAGVLATGAEDVTYWPERHQLWTLTEWPHRRWVYAIDPDAWPGPDFEDAQGL